MDFFARQAATRRQSRWMVFLFVVAVIAIVIAIDFVVVATVAVLSVQDDGGLLASPDMSLSRYPMAVLFSTVVVLGTIGISCLVRTASLAAGGGKVAEQLGGTRVGADTTDPLKRRLRNVVEEVAIASGVPVPQVYVLEREAGINAFAAGYSPANAAIAVTRGALVNLNRDELQGVIAHEFSHVLNGDMRLSTRLIGLLFGLTVIAMIARTILRLAPRGGGGRKGGGGILVIFLAAFVVLALGWIGLFFGRLIQAAVSRHRESLADASAVQFTRDPQGLRNALVKIGALGAGSRFADADAEEVAHLLFAEGIGRAFATHPPLVERIREIDPQFQPAEFDAVRRRMGEARAMAEEEAAREAQPAARRGGPLAGAIALAPAAVAGLVANPGTEHVLEAQLVLESLPESFRRAARQPGQATALFVALAIDAAPEARERQLAFIDQQYGQDHVQAVKAMLPQVDALTARAAHAGAPAGVRGAQPARARGARRAPEVPERIAGPRKSRLGLRVRVAQARAGAATGQPGSAPARRGVPERSGRARRAAGAVLDARDAGQRGRGVGTPGLRGGDVHPDARDPSGVRAARALAAEARPGARAHRPPAAGGEEPAGAGPRRDDLPRRPHDRRRVRVAARDLRDAALPAAAALCDRLARGLTLSVTCAAARPRRGAKWRSSGLR